MEARKVKAERYVRDVVGDEERADEIAEESVEAYAERRGFVINPSQFVRAVESVGTNKVSAQMTSAPAQRKGVKTVEAEQQLIDYIAELEENNQRLAEENLAIGSRLGDIVTVAGGVVEEDDDSDDAVSIETPKITNGMFSDAAGYVGGRLKSRSARKKYERAVSKEAVSKARTEAARKRLS
jgi:hypothetical protein